MLKELSNLKKIPLRFLLNLGVKDCKQGIEIPYRLMDGSPAPRKRIRKGLSSKDGWLWLGEGEIVPYGLWRPKSKYLIFVEGESDCWTLWFNGFEALGFPGSSIVRILKPEYLIGVLKIYVWQEPDKGGQTFVAKIAEQLFGIGYSGKSYVLRDDKFKDPSDLWLERGKDFTKTMRYLIANALILPAYVPPKPRVFKKDFVNGDLTDAMIERARNYQFVRLTGTKVGSKMLCPGHKDSRASLHIYADHAFCFVCGFRADSISWLQLGGMTFKQSVEALQDD